MNVLLISGDYPPKPGGIGVYGQSLGVALSLRPEVRRVTVLALGEWGEGVEAAGKLAVIRLPRPGRFSLAFVVGAAVSKLKPDLLHGLTLYPEGFWTAMQASGRRPLVLSLYGTEVAPFGRTWTRWAKALTLRQAAAVFPISQATAERARRNFKVKPERSRVIPPGLPGLDQAQPGDPDRAGLGLAAEDFVVLSCARLVRRKGVDDLLKALPRLPERVKLVVVGEGEERGRLEALAAELGLAGRVVFTGQVARTGPYYRLADAFALASTEDEASGDFEGFGIVLLEAQAHGLPVVGTNSGGIPEAFAPDVTGLLVPPGDPAALAEALGRLAVDPALRLRLRAQGPRLILDKFLWPDLAGRFVAAYQEVLPRP